LAFLSNRAPECGRTASASTRRSRTFCLGDRRHCLAFKGALVSRPRLRLRPRSTQPLPYARPLSFSTRGLPQEKAPHDGGVTFQNNRVRKVVLRLSAYQIKIIGWQQGVIFNHPNHLATVQIHLGNVGILQLPGAVFFLPQCPFLGP
jgi:hypothetical protein